jgi:hypothetical protein
MTEFEDRDDYEAEEVGAERFGAEPVDVGEIGAEEDGAEERGAEARELFARTVAEAEHRPRPAFTAEDLVLGGRRQVRRRRVGAALAGTASVAAVAVAVTAFGVGGAVLPASASGPEVRDAKLANALVAKLYSELDPGGHHLSLVLPQKPSVDFFLKFGGGACDDKTQSLLSYGYLENWTADGKAPDPRVDSGTSPAIEIIVALTAPESQEGQFTSDFAWGPIVQATLTDGSTVTMASANAGHHLQVTRTMSDKRKIVLYVTDASNAPTSPPIRPTEPFPYTAQQLGRIVGGLSLPLPFPDSYRSQRPCSP